MQIDVVCCFDDNLALQAAIMATSMASHASLARPVVLHAFFLGPIGAVDLDEVARRLNSPAFTFKPRQIANPFDEISSIAAENPSYYLRLAVIGSIDIADRLIYLDVDTLINDEMSSLFDTDLGSRAVAACLDPGMEQARSSPRKATHLLMSSVVMRDYVERLVGLDNCYINSGVMVINVLKWKASDISGKCLRFIEEAPHVLFADQDALNHVMRGDVALLDPRWNCIPMYETDSKAISSAGIVHYAGYKPWKAGDQAQLGEKEYWTFAMSTPYGKILRSCQRREIKYIYENGKKRFPSAFKMLCQNIRKLRISGR